MKVGLNRSFFDRINRMLGRKPKRRYPKRPRPVCFCGKTITRKLDGTFLRHKCNPALPLLHSPSSDCRCFRCEYQRGLGEVPSILPRLEYSDPPGGIQIDHDGGTNLLDEVNRLRTIEGQEPLGKVKA